MEKLNLQIPENMAKLFNDVIRVLMDKSGVDRRIAEKLAGFIGQGEGKDYKGMFEAVIEHIIEEREEARKQGLEKGIEQGFVQGKEQGFVLGHEQEKFEIAARFKNLGISIDTIIQATGLIAEEIKKL